MRFALAVTSEDRAGYGLNIDATSGGVCAWCGEHIRCSEAGRVWRATGYADLGGYCRQSPEQAHGPRQER